MTNPTQTPQQTAASAAPQAASAKAVKKEKSRFESLRLLPLLMIVGTLTFGVKLGNVWNGADDLFAGMPEAQAEESVQDIAPEAAAEHEAEGQAEPAAAPAQDAGEPYSQGELQLLENLADRRAELDERTKEIEMREKVLDAMEQRIDEKIAEMKRIEAQVAAYLKDYDAEHIENMKSLVKMYESMKPKDAARIFEQLHMDILLEVAGNMKERSMAAVLAEMTPDAAKSLTVEMATKKPIPLASN